MNHLQNLNPPQLEAVKHHTGPILILAGAGSGKTRVLTHRIAHLVIEHGARPDSILAVTFTNKATEEMRSRLSGLLGDQARELWVATFHSMGLRILRRHAQLLSYSNDFVIYDDQDSRGVMKGILKEMSVDEKRFPVSHFMQKIDQAKNALILPEHYHKHNTGFEATLEAEAYDRYQKALMKSNAMDFGDLLLNTVLLLKKVPDVRKLYQNQLHFVLVDEFQDTNVVQYMLLRLLTESRRNLLVVGDDDQSIYAFRGATIRNILDFEKDYPDTKVIKLEQNYRSSSNILNAANEVICKNKSRKSKKLWTSTEGGAPIATYVAMDESGEANFVADKIRHFHRQGLAYKDIAIFYRTNAQSRALEEALLSAKIPYRIFGGLKFYDRKEIKDVLAYLKLLVNESDNQSLTRVINTPPRGIGAQSLQVVSDLATEKNISLLQACSFAAEKSKNVASFMQLMETLRRDLRESNLSSLISAVVEKSEYGPRLKALKDPQSDSRLENLQELQAIARTMETPGGGDTIGDLRRFLDRIALTSSAELPVEETKDRANVDNDEKPNMVSLMTLHLAKGLEYPLVFFTGLEEGLVPHHRSIDDPRAIEEERRLCYVGITRAMQQLFLTRAMSRGMFSSGEGFGMGGFYRQPSRYVLDIPKSCMDPNGADFAKKFQSLEKINSEDDLDDDLNFSEPTRGYFPQPSRGNTNSGQRKSYRSDRGTGMAVFSADQLSSRTSSSSGQNIRPPTRVKPKEKDWFIRKKRPEQ